MRTNQCLKLKKDMKKNKGRNMTTNTTNQNMTTNQNSNMNHNFSNLHYMKYRPTRIKNSSARECYSVWAHQQANPNLVEMPVHKITKQIYDNSNNNRPMFYGLLKSDLPPSGTAPPPPKSKDPRDAPN
ncbi:hypothetical protein PIB30_046325 [Stylosanthes scabra]|uniref:Uncharacterized protein n=1 Tax=Stylosanthes scabra TaxID=79078 RepID=A0ABU6UF23_9FABA|nr:hypothetical protein [Stylosanthes scabra]